VFDKTGTLTTPAVALPDTLSPDDIAVAKALAQASQHPLSKALVAACPDVVAATLSQIVEVPGQGVEGLYQSRLVRLGRGTWLDADFVGLGLKLGDAPATEISATETLRDGIPTALRGLNMPCEIVTGDAPEPAQRIADQLDLPVTSRALPDDKLARLQGLADNGERVLMVGDGLNDTAHRALHRIGGIAQRRRHRRIEIQFLSPAAGLRGGLGQSETVKAELCHRRRVQLYRRAGGAGRICHATGGGTCDVDLVNHRLDEFATDEVREMNVLVVLIPVSLVLGAVGLIAFLWTVRSDQYDDALEEGGSGCYGSGQQRMPLVRAICGQGCTRAPHAITWCSGSPAVVFVGHCHPSNRSPVCAPQKESRGPLPLRPPRLEVFPTP